MNYIAYVSAKTNITEPTEVTIESVQTEPSETDIQYSDVDCDGDVDIMGCDPDEQKPDD